MSAKSLAVRITHWVIALIVVINSFILLDGDIVHEVIGYIAMAFVGYRLLFLRHKKFEYLKNYTIYVYSLIWFTLFIITLSGFMMGLDYFWGSHLPDDIHYYSSQFLIVLVIVHILGVLRDSYIHKRATWKLMIKGRF